MAKHALHTAVYTGSFDPITLGHLNIIERSSRLFDHLIVGIGVNPNKEVLFSIEERVELTRRVVAAMPDVSVRAFEGLTVRFVREVGARFILRGLGDEGRCNHTFKVFANDTEPLLSLALYARG